MEGDLGGLTEAEGRAWHAAMRAHARCVRQMDAELESVHGTALTSYDVLRQLGLAPERRLRMAELADRVFLSRPGLTGVVKRLEAAGLLAREPAPDDGRGSLAVLTPEGYERVVAWHRTHVRSIRTLFTDRFSEAELRQLADLLGRV